MPPVEQAAVTGPTAADLWSLAEFEAAAYARLPPRAVNYIAGAAGDGRTMRGNRDAFGRWVFCPRLLVDVSQRDLSTTVLGHRIDFPVMVAPSSLHALSHPDGELATARAAGSAGTVMVASTGSSHPMESIAAAATGPLWFQLYWLHDWALTRELVQRACAAGFKALCLTIDSPVAAWRENELRLPLTPEDLRLGNITGVQATASDLTWDALSRLRSICPLPLVLKGILAAEDARLAVEHGADAIIVSNHGGRQVDDTVATLDALPAVIEAVDGRLEVYVDGGVRRGTDVLKALALGARATLIGRPALWGLAVDGQAGVARVLSILRSELEAAMGNLGTPTTVRITRDILLPRPC